jgi:hypothetical protein
VEVKVGFKSQLASKDRKKVMRKEDRRKLTYGDVLEKEDDGRDGKLRRHGPNELRREDGRADVSEARRDGLKDGDRVVLRVLVNGDPPSGLKEETICCQSVKVPRAKMEEKKKHARQ